MRHLTNEEKHALAADVKRRVTDALAPLVLAEDASVCTCCSSRAFAVALADLMAFHMVIAAHGTDDPEAELGLFIEAVASAMARHHRAVGAQLSAAALAVRANPEKGVH